jgi:hypothetical protein
MRKNMQKWVIQIHGILLFTFSFQLALGADSQQLLQRADSLFAQKKFAEARGVYFQLYESGFHTPATLLKMAFVHEGLGESGQALFFLSTYYQETEDQKAYEKIQTLANARGLTGFELSDWDQLIIFTTNRVVYYLPVLFALLVFFALLMVYYRKHSLANGKLAAGFVTLFLIGLCFVSVNLLQLPQRAVVSTSSYLMSGPSAAATFVSMIPEGNRVKISGEQDIWVEIEWNERTGYIRKSDLMLTR